ncbi:hypothetical protein ACEZ3G_05205 [Maribacter algicola]|uniref:Uncharacterized protein n=1 Tax=Meishania litoralis TaxID=3434685 RepID=A0ACC7LIL5_9FLAO
MRGTRFNIILGFLLLAIPLLLASIYWYNKPHLDVKQAEASYVLTAQNLIDEYQENEIATNEKYSESVILVKGRVFEVSTLKGNSVITLKDEDSESSIICHLLPEENGKVLNLKVGQDIGIKGICTGYLLDVIMVRCTIVE